MKNKKKVISKKKGIVERDYDLFKKDMNYIENIIGKDVKHTERWMIERKKFFFKLAIIVVVVLLLIFVFKVLIR